MRQATMSPPSSWSWTCASSCPPSASCSMRSSRSLLNSAMVRKPPNRSRYDALVDDLIPSRYEIHESPRKRPPMDFEKDMQEMANALQVMLQKRQSISDMDSSLLTLMKGQMSVNQ